MKNIHLIILYFCFLFASLSSSYDIKPDGETQYRECMRNANETLLKTSIACEFISFILPLINAFFFDLSGDTFDSIIFENHTYLGYDEEYMLSICVCRESFDTVFFTIPSSDYKGRENVVLCVINENSFASLGIYDTHELYDLLLSQRIENYPASLLRAEQTRREDDEPGCFDFDGYPTKNIFGEKTCMLEAERHKNRSLNYEYSGPLFAKVFYQFLNIWDYKYTEYCFTTLNNSLGSTDSYRNGMCYFLNDAIYSKVLCCCPYGTQTCRKRNDNLLCSHGEYPVSELIPHIKAQEFFNESIKGCTIRMTASLNQSTSNIEFKASYDHQTEICQKNITTDSNEMLICSNRSIGFESLIINGCCNNTNFCNFDFLPPRVNMKIPIRCVFKPYLAFYIDKTINCDVYFDLTLKKRVFVYDKFNCDFIESTNKQTLQINDAYELMFVKITKVDSKDCDSRNYNKTHLNKIQPFIRFICDTNDCDEQFPLLPSKNKVPLVSVFDDGGVHLS